MKNGNRVGKGRRFQRPVVALTMSSMHLRVVQQRRRCVLAWRDFAQQLRIAFEQGVDGLGYLAGHTPDHLRFAHVGLHALVIGALGFDQPLIQARRRAHSFSRSRTSWKTARNSICFMVLVPPRVNRE